MLHVACKLYAMTHAMFRKKGCGSVKFWVAPLRAPGPYYPPLAKKILGVRRANLRATST